MVKADDPYYYCEDIGASFTNFEELKMRVTMLQEQLDEVTEILRCNDIVRKKIIKAEYLDEDELYKRLGE